MAGAKSTSLVVTATLLIFATTIDGHSFLIHPEADWLDRKQPECRIGKPDGPQFDSFAPMNCPGPCGQTGLLQDRGWYFFSEDQGHTKLSRGQKMYMKWTRNNHFSGFVRFTLVPKSERMNKGVHDKFAFHYSCWEAGEVGCDANDECGTDEMRLRYQTEVEIPRIFPDGEYILGWSWYGGSKHIDGSDKAEYGDYYSCANVEIHGSINGNGAWQDDKGHESEYTPVFIPGMNDKGLTKCKSAVNRLGVCVTEPCYARYEASWMEPAGFENGSSPPPIKAADVLAITGGDSAYTPTTNDGEDGGGRSGFKIKRVELINTWDMSVVSSNLEHQIDVSSFKQYATLRAIVEPAQKVRVVEFVVSGKTTSANSAPFYIAGTNQNGKPIAWQKRGGFPMNQDFTLTVRALGYHGAVEETVLYPHFRSG